MREAIERDEFRTPVSPEGLRVVQITNDDRRDSNVGCQNTIRWTPDSRFLLFGRDAAKDGAAKAGIWICDTEDRFSIRSVYEWDTFLFSHTPYGREAEGTLAFTLNPDGSGIFLMRRVKGMLELCRVDIETGRSEATMTAPAPLSTGWLLDASSDGQHVVFHVFLGDGKTEGAPWGLRVFDVKNAKTWVVELDNASHRGACYRKGGGYCPVELSSGAYDLVTHVRASPKLSDGSWRTPPDGTWRPDAPPEDTSKGYGHTVIFRDDGSDFPRQDLDGARVIPMPRPPQYIASHACWRGREARSWIASMYNVSPQKWRAPFIETWPATVSGADRKADRDPPEARWVDLTRLVSRADACHFDFDASGRHVVTDTDGYVLPQTCMLYVGTYVEPEGGDPYFKTRLLGIPRTSWKTQAAHPHPFLSPDGRYAVFQSDFSGRPQVHVAYGFEYP
jgi:hypothetical protein